MTEFRSFQPRSFSPARSRFNGCRSPRPLGRRRSGSSSLHAHQIALSQGYSLDHSGARDIAVMRRATFAAPSPDRQAQLGADGPAVRAYARGSGPPADFEQVAAIPSRFVPQLAGQLAQARIAGGARQLVVGHHPFHVVRLEAERLVLADQRPTQLVQGILARVGHAGVQACDPFLLGFAPVRAFGFAAQSPLGRFQFSRFLIEGFGISRLPTLGSDRDRKSVV